MLYKKIILSNHVKDRFEQRHIKYTNNKSKKYTIDQQVRFDLKPLNIIRIERLNELDSRITTRQGKKYIVRELEDNNCLLVKTVYKSDLREEKFRYIKENARYDKFKFN